MSRGSISFVLTFTALLLATTVSCQRGLTPAKQPGINPSEAGKLAMEQYDKNGDGVVSGAELDQAPGLKAALKNLDTNGDGGVSADEVAARVNAWKAMEVGMILLRCRVTLDGEPLTGAKVVFEPEQFLGDEIKAAAGETNVYGDAGPVIPPEQRTDPKLPGGAHIGLYKVRISKIVNGKESIPARYNSETILGQEVSFDDPAIKNRNMNFALKSK
jgi:hypothetical protein